MSQVPTKPILIVLVISSVASFVISAPQARYQSSGSRYCKSSPEADNMFTCLNFS